MSETRNLSKWLILPEMSDTDLIRKFDTDALLTLDCYAALWERGLICYSDKGMKTLQEAGER